MFAREPRWGTEVILHSLRKLTQGTVTMKNPRLRRRIRPRNPNDRHDRVDRRPPAAVLALLLALGCAAPYRKAMQTHVRPREEILAVRVHEAEEALREAAVAASRASRGEAPPSAGGDPLLPVELALFDLRKAVASVEDVWGQVRERAAAAGESVDPALAARHDDAVAAMREVEARLESAAADETVQAGEAVRIGAAVEEALARAAALRRELEVDVPRERGG